MSNSLYQQAVRPKRQFDYILGETLAQIDTGKGCNQWKRLHPDSKRKGRYNNMTVKLLKPYKGFEIEKSYEEKADGTIKKRYYYLYSICR